MASHQHPKRRNKPKRHTMQDSRTLPLELINEILLRLPVKPLLKCRSVSKSWLALISSPQFINTHLSLSVNNKDQIHHRLMLGFEVHRLKYCSFMSLFYNLTTWASDLDYPLNIPHIAFSPVGSVNGLICLVHGTKDVFIWNPSIRKYNKLPYLRSKFVYDNHMYGFGYDELHDDYKVVRIFISYGYDTSPRLDIKIYSLKSDSWRKIHYSEGGKFYTSSGVFVNGKLHWITNPNKMITSIDLADENWGKMEQPCRGERGHVLVLGVLGSYLSMFSHAISTGVDGWVMKEYGLEESWTKMFSIKYPRDDIGIHPFLPPIFLSNMGEILVLYRSTFMIYNPKDDSIRRLEVINFGDWHKAEMYIESLVSPEDATKRKASERLKKLRSRQSSNK